MNCVDKSLPRSTLGSSVVADPVIAFEREWQVVNGIGGYAASSLCGANTRCYHGLLVAAQESSTGCFTYLSKLDEEVSFAGRNYCLGVNERHDSPVEQTALKHLERFELEGNIPTFHYRLAESAVLSKTVWMEYGLNTTYIRYTNTSTAGNDPLSLTVYPLANNRDYLSTTTGQLNQHYAVKVEKVNQEEPLSAWTVQATPEAACWRLVAFDRPVQWEANTRNGWQWNLHYRHEPADSQRAREDLYCLGAFTVDLSPGQSVTFAASTEELALIEQLYSAAYGREQARQQALLYEADIDSPDIPEPDPDDNLLNRLILAADQFIVGLAEPDRPGQLKPDFRSLSARYPWFNEWGRYLLLSLPGLTLATGRYGEAALLLKQAADKISRLNTEQGCLSEQSEVEPGGSDGRQYRHLENALWFCLVLDKYLKISGDLVFARQAYPQVARIVKSCLISEDYPVKMTSDGLLLITPDNQVQKSPKLSSATPNFKPATRQGKPVELNALWYRACRLAQELAWQFGTSEDTCYYAAISDTIAGNFEKVFWNERDGYFYDSLDHQGHPDRTLAIQQIVAMAVCSDLIDINKFRTALNQTATKLLTPARLANCVRAGAEPAGQTGIQVWQLGLFCQAVLKLDLSLEERRKMLVPYIPYLAEVAASHYHGMFEAMPPFPPIGNGGQLMAVAQLLEMWRELQVVMAG